MAVSDEDVEFAIREYTVITNHLIEVLEKCDDKQIPKTIKGALILLEKAIAHEWDR